MSGRPNDLVPGLIWEHRSGPNFSESRAYVNPGRHEQGCHVYWGSHGCDRPRGHDGPHWCACCECSEHPDPDSGCVAGPPYYGEDTNFYGEDAA